MISTQFTVIGKAQVDAFIQKMIGIPKTIPVWLKNGEPDEIMRSSFQQNFSKEGRPTKWAPLSEKAINIRTSEGFPGEHPILVRTGNMMDEMTNMLGEIKSSAGSHSMSWGINQLRADSAKKLKAHETGELLSGKKIPKRPVLIMQKEDMNNLSSSLEKFLMSQLV